MRLLVHARANAIAYLALFVALGGTSAWAAATIGAGDIKPKAVRAKHIKSNQVKEKHLGAGAVTTSKLADGLVTTPKLADGLVTTPKLAADAVTSNEIADGSVGLGDLGVIPAARVDKPLEFGAFIPNDSEVLADLGEPIFETVPGMYDSGSSRFVAPVAGVYEATAAFIWATNTTGVRRLTLKKNDSYVIGQSDIAAVGDHGFLPTSDHRNSLGQTTARA